MKVLSLIVVISLGVFLDRAQSEIDPNTVDMKDVLARIGDLEQTIGDLRQTVKNLAKQTLAQQLFVEERIRSDGHSGIKQTRGYKHGTDAYFESTHVSKAAMSVHDHSNSRDVMGMGETIVVMNGVEFRTRHNDYTVRQASTTDTSFNAVEPLKYPDVPPEVLAKPTFDEQITEMQAWIRAFEDQDDSVRDYKKYFRPLMCYMEGAWTLDKHLVEPFESQRHSLEANSWDELKQQIQYTSYTGAKGAGENFSFLPSAIISVNDTTGKPLYAQWNYRILCHPYSGDIPRHYLKPQDDLSYMTSHHRSLESVSKMRAGRYKLSEFSSPRFTGTTLLDKIMAEIPGKDNIPPPLNEEPMEGTMYKTSGGGKLNTGYYHRMYKSGAKDASGSQSINRAFSDAQLYFAETTQERIAPVSFKHCYNKRNCVTRSTRFTYAIPLEVVYMTPLLNWNPLNLTVWSDREIPRANGRNGELGNRDKAFNGTSVRVHWYVTPAKLFSSSSANEDFDPADTVSGAVSVIDKNGNLQTTVSSGTQIHMRAVPGGKPLRLRFPMFSLHVEGSTIWKELSIVKSKLYAAEVTLKNDYYHIGVRATTVSGSHDHEFYMSQESFKRAKNQEIISATTSLDNGHSHELLVTFNKAGSSLFMTSCDGQDKCWDAHPIGLRIASRP